MAQATQCLPRPGLGGMCHHSWLHLILCVGVLSPYMSVYYMHIWCPEKPDDDCGSLEWELRNVVSHHIRAGNRIPRSSKRSINAPNCEPSLQSPPHNSFLTFERIRRMVYLEPTAVRYKIVSDTIFTKMIK